MGKIRMTYDIEFKKKAVNLYLKEGMGYKTVAKELEIEHLKRQEKTERERNSLT